MDLLKETKELCGFYHIKPNRSKGQNFLVKEEMYDKIIETADIRKDDIILEVGPGLGFLTAKLAAKAKQVIAVELDRKLAEILPVRLEMQGIKNVKVVNEDILKIFNFQFSIFNPPALTSRWKFKKKYYTNCAINIFDTRNSQGEVGRGQFSISNFQNAKYKIVANLPYNITSIFLRKALTLKHKPEEMTLMLQKEVAERIAAKPPKMSLLAVSVQFYAEPKIILKVPANNFWPKPEVDSAIIKIAARSKSDVGYPISGFAPEKEKDFFRLIKIGFSARRKMLKNNLAAGFHISQNEAEEKIAKADFDLKIRAQELSVEDWLRLFEYFN